MRVDTDILGERIAEHVAHIDAAMHLLLTDLREFDQAGGWDRQGFQTCAHWLSWRVGWTLGTAREHVRVAAKLAELPQIDEALRTGEMSYSKVRAMTRVATPANEHTLLEEACHTTGHQLETICRKYALVQRHGKESTEKDDSERRYVKRRDQPDGMVQIVATLHPEEAAAVWAALERIVKEGYRGGDGTRSAGSIGANDDATPNANDLGCDVPARGRSTGSIGANDDATPNANELGCDVPAGTRSAGSGGVDEAACPTVANELGCDVPAGMRSAESGGVDEAACPTVANDLGCDVPAGMRSAGSIGANDDATPTANELGCDVPAGTRIAGSGGVDEATGPTGASHLGCDVPAGTRSAGSGSPNDGASRTAASELGCDVSAGTLTRVATARPEPMARRDAKSIAKQRFGRADALVVMAEEVIRGSRPNRSPIELVVTVAAADLRASTTAPSQSRATSADNPRDAATDPMTAACFVDGTAVSRTVARRLACDAGLVGIVEDGSGAALSVGRKTRAIPAAMKRALLKRDGCCRFPGCTNRVFVEGHHMEHWVDGGETTLRNLLTLCRHHRFVHEYGYVVEWNGAEVRFIDPDGNAVRAVPEPVRPERLGWETIRARNAGLAIDASTPACGWDGGRIDLVSCIDELVRADDRGGTIRHN